MFGKIFKFEISYWLKSPLWYSYMAAMLIIATLITATAVGVFDSATVSVTGIKKINSPISIAGLLGGFTFLVYFLLPSIIGNSIYKDYKSEMYQVLFSYPFSKTDYLLAKFLSSFLMTLGVLFFAVIGLIIGCYLPGANQDLLLDFELLNYLQPFVLVVIPNLFFFGTIVFGVVTFSRNIFIGFITVLILIVLQGLAGNYLGDLDTKTLAALLDPLGGSAISYETEYWTVEEQNNNFIPFSGYILYNRILWSVISLLIFLGVFNAFKFHQNPISLKIFKKKSKRFVKQNFGGYKIHRTPTVQLDFSLSRKLKNVWKFATFELKYILKNWAFISIFAVGILMVVLVLNLGYQIQGTDTLPITRIMISLSQGGIGLFMMILIFLFSGMLMHRGNISHMDQLLDTTAQPSWIFMTSKFVAILQMIAVIFLSVIGVSIAYQAISGFYDFEIGLYLFDYFFVDFPNWIIYTFLAFFIHSLIKNYIVGFITLIALFILLQFFPSFGIEQSIFNFNKISGTSYSDMNGYGHGLSVFYIYKIYWGLFGIALFVIASLLYQRGLTNGFKARLRLAGKRFSSPRKVVFFGSLVLFFSLGGYIYYIDNIKNERYSGKEYEKGRVKYEKEFGHYASMKKPRITASKIDLAIYPETRDYKVEGVFTMENKTEEAIDSIYLQTSDDLIDYSFSIPTEVSLTNERFNFEVLQFKKSLQPGEKITFNFTMKNEPNSWLRNNSPIQYNGTFLNNRMLPSFGYNESYEHSSEKIREKYDLPYKERMSSPHDSTALGDTYISSEADWIDFEATISTSSEQIAIAPGYLQKEWSENGRRYFHYKMEDKMLNFYNIMSAEYEVVSEKHEGINLQIFYHPGHEYNLERMMDGAKKSLSYYQENFSPYQFRQLRIIEFPSTYGSFAQSFANTVPFSEGIGFIANVEEENDGVDYPFTITAHEVAHQWWAHQVIGANVQGSTLMSESLSEYSALKVLEKRYGETKMRRFLKDALDNYLSGRSSESKREQPLLYNENKPYIHYNKGSLVLYALSDYIGTKKFNNMLADYIDAVGFQDAPYTTSLEFTEHLKKATPDSLQYLVYDMIETITLYNNKVLDYEVNELENGKYEISLKAQVSKYRTTDYGTKNFENYESCSISYSPENEDEETAKIESLPLKDYIEIGIFTEDDEENEEVLYLKKRKVTEIYNEFTIVVDQKPTEVGIDPYNKLIDRNSEDNRMEVE
ncbi:M1 family aminopeptidase [Mesonia aquimarina]|uniref:M1 family aminopeptidase n=1 Tax=Mesonia aquimarina TaxID=1504967 RepID=UPI000EF57631|nr:M1 family aminopeptidase [Mesonia aquimarina]